jgi:hypothetical protein
MHPYVPFQGCSNLKNLRIDEVVSYSRYFLTHLIDITLFTPHNNHTKYYNSSLTL